MSDRLPVAIAQYPIEALHDEAAYRTKVSGWVEEATAAGARLLVFPEYAAMELAALAGPDTAADLQRSIDAVTERWPLHADLHTDLAKRHQVTILAGSGPVRQSDGRALNVARLFSTDGAVTDFPKIKMTPWEADPWEISGCGHPSAGPVDVDGVKVGVAICYDMEFPTIARAQAEQGAVLLLAPSCTETLHGWWRVRIACQARALENQCYAVHAPLIGAAPWCPPVDENHGAAGLFGPPDIGFPVDGTIVSGEIDRPGWIYGEVDLQAIERVRTEGGTRNFADW